VYSHPVSKRVEDFRKVVQKQKANLEKLWRKYQEVTEKLEAAKRMLTGAAGGGGRADFAEDYMTAKARIQQQFKTEAEAVLSRYQAKTKALHVRVEKHEDASVAMSKWLLRCMLTILQSWRKKKQAQENAQKQYETVLKQIAEAAGDEIDGDDEDEIDD
jgi:F0F1-type ATP synthase membrane subunit b/b'